MKVEAIKFMLWAEDMDRAVAFYRDVFGLEPRFTSEHWSELVHGDAIVALHGGGEGTFRESGLSIQVDDLDAGCERFVAAGGTVRSGPEKRENEPIRLAYVTDPEGNGFGMTQFVG